MNFRLDRFLTLYLFHPMLPRARGRAAILMYHSISDGYEGVHPYYGTVTSPGVFAAQMRFLHENRCKVIDLMALVEEMNAGRQPADGSVVLTFDDGFQDFYTTAFPVLLDYGFPATVFLVTGLIDRGEDFNGRRCLSWQEVRELGKYGVSFGSHSVSHALLSRISEKQLLQEIVRSKERIESELGAGVHAFSYPFAFPEPDRAHLKKLVSVLSNCGYRCGVSTRIGTTSKEDNVFYLRRLPVNSFDDHRLLKAKLEGGYDWLHKFQFAYKRIAGPSQDDA